MSDETWVVTLPKLGETVTEGVIGTIFTQVGDKVEFDDPLFEVSTDKVDSEIPSPYDGVILEILAQPGETRSGRCPGAAHRWHRNSGREPAALRVARRGCRRWSFPRRSLGAVDGRIGRAGRPRRPVSRRRATARSTSITMPKLGETVTEGTVSSWLKQVGDDGRVRRSAVRGVDRQGRFGDPEPVRRHAAGDPRPRRARRCRSAPCSPASATRPGRRPAAPARRSRLGAASTGSELRSRRPPP